MTSTNGLLTISQNVLYLLKKNKRNIKNEIYFVFFYSLYLLLSLHGIVESELCNFMSTPSIIPSKSRTVNGDCPSLIYNVTPPPTRDFKHNPDAFELFLPSPP